MRQQLSVIEQEEKEESKSEGRECQVDQKDVVGGMVSSATDRGLNISEKIGQSVGTDRTVDICSSTDSDSPIISQKKASVRSRNHPLCRSLK